MKTENKYLKQQEQRLKEYRDELAKEEAKRNRVLKKVFKVLKDNGIEMGVNACGCCNGAHVYFAHKGKVLVNWEEDFAFKTDGVPEEEGW